MNGFIVAPQRRFEINMDSYYSDNYGTFKYLIEKKFDYCDFFQDVPFSMPHFYKFLDKNFEDSKFILTIRDTPEEWYESVINFHKKITNKDLVDIEKVNYQFEGFISDFLRMGMGTPKKNIYSKKHLIDSYEKHIIDVENYFRSSKKLIKLNLSENKVDELSDFLNFNFKYNKFPHLNKTE